MLCFNLEGHMWKFIKNWFQKCSFCEKFCGKLYSLIWDSHVICGKGGGDTLALLVGGGWGWGWVVSAPLLYTYACTCTHVCMHKYICTHIPIHVNHNKHGCLHGSGNIGHFSMRAGFLPSWVKTNKYCKVRRKVVRPIKMLYCPCFGTLELTQYHNKTNALKGYDLGEVFYFFGETMGKPGVNLKRLQPANEVAGR